MGAPDLWYDGGDCMSAESHADGREHVVAAAARALAPGKWGVAAAWSRMTTWYSQLSQAERIFFGLIILAYVYFLQPRGTNTLSRYDMVSALANGTAVIDAHASNTIDVSLYHGHLYSPRSIGLSLFAVPAYWGVQALESLIGTQTVDIQIALLNLCTVAPAAIAAVIVFERFLPRVRPALRGTSLPVAAAGAFGLATFFFPMATDFFSHAFSGALAFIGFYLLFRARSATHPERWLALAGLLVGVAIISEYQVGVIMLVLAAYVWASFPGRRRRALLIFAAGMAPAALILGWYDWFAFGNPLHLSYEFVSGSQFAGQHTGLFGITYPRLSAYWQILAYPRGLLVESPFLALVPLGFYRWLRSGAPPPAEALVCLAISLVYPTIIAGYYLPMAGENLPGPRLLTPMLPFACLALGWVVDDARLLVRYAFAALLAAGLVLSFLYVASGVREDHTRLTYPWTGLYWPILRTGQVPKLDGPTPLTLATQLLRLPTLASLYLIFLPLLAWLAWAVWTLVRGNTSAYDSTEPAPRAALEKRRWEAE